MSNTEPRDHELSRRLVALWELDRLREVCLEDRRVLGTAALDERTNPALRTRSLALTVRDDRGDDLFGEGVEEVGGIERAAVNDESNVLRNVALGVELTDCRENCGELSSSVRGRRANGGTTHSLPASIPSKPPSSHRSPTSNRFPCRRGVVAGCRQTQISRKNATKGKAEDEPKLHEVAAAVLTTVHLGVHLHEKLVSKKRRRGNDETDDTAILSLAVDVVNLGHETSVGDGRVEDVVEVDGKDGKEAFLAGRRDGVGGVGCAGKGKVSEQRVWWVKTHAVHALVPAAKLRLQG